MIHTLATTGGEMVRRTFTRRGIMGFFPCREKIRDCPGGSMPSEAEKF